jgi:hypothetical protein
MKRRKHFYYLLLLLFLPHVVFSQHSKIIVKGSKVLKRESRDISNVQNIEVQSGIMVYLRIGDVETMEIEAEDNLIQHINTITTANTVKIELPGNIVFSDILPVKIYLQLNKIENLKASEGASIISTNTLSSNKISINLSKGSEVKVDLNCKDLSVNMLGGSAANITGKTVNGNFEIKGASKFEGDNLSAEICSVVASGASEIRLNADKQISITASQGSKITYFGNPLVLSKNATGKSKVKNGKSKI